MSGHDLLSESIELSNASKSPIALRHFLAFTASVVVLLFNIVFLIFTTVRAQQGQDVALSRGDCEQVHRLSVGFHWIINALSTILLAASNFGMVPKIFSRLYWYSTGLIFYSNAW